MQFHQEQLRMMGLNTTCVPHPKFEAGGLSQAYSALVCIRASAQSHAALCSASALLSCSRHGKLATRNHSHTGNPCRFGTAGPWKPDNGLDSAVLGATVCCGGGWHEAEGWTRHDNVAKWLLGQATQQVSSNRERPSCFKCSKAAWSASKSSRKQATALQPSPVCVCQFVGAERLK